MREVGEHAGLVFVLDSVLSGAVFRGAARLRRRGWRFDGGQVRSESVVEDPLTEVWRLGSGLGTGLRKKGT